MADENITWDQPKEDITWDSAPPSAAPVRELPAFQQRQHAYRENIHAGAPQLPAGAAADVKPQPELQHDFGQTAKGIAKGVPAGVAGGVVGDFEELGRTGINWVGGKDTVSPHTFIPTTVEGGYLGDRGIGILPPATSEDEKGGMAIGSMLTGPPTSALFKGARAGVRAIKARLPEAPPSPPLAPPREAPPGTATIDLMTAKPPAVPEADLLPRTPEGAPVAVARDGSGARLLPADVPHVETAGTLEDTLAGRRSAGAAGRSPLAEFSPETIAHMRKTLEQEGVTPWTLEQRLEEMSPHQSLAEFSPNTEAHAGATASPPGAGKNEIVNFFGQRAREAKDRMRSTFDQAFGPAEDLAQQNRVLNIDQSAEAGPLYERFRSMEIPPTPSLDALVPRLQSVGAFGEARAKALAEGRPWQQEWFTPEQRSAPTAQSWDYVKRALDQKIGGSYDPVSGRATDWTRIYTNLKNDLLSAINRHPDPEIASVWREARQAWAGPEEVKNAQRLGRRLLTKAVDADEFRFESAGFGEHQMQGLRQGLRKELENSLGNPGKTELPVMKQVLGENNQQKLRWVIGDEATDALVRSIEHEFNMHGAPTRIHGNSPTALRQEANKFWTPQPGLFSAKDLASALHGISGAAAHVAKKTFLARHEASQQAKFARLRDEAARIYTMQGPERDAVLRYLLSEPRSPTRITVHPAPGQGTPRAKGGRVIKRADGGRTPKVDYQATDLARTSKHEIKASYPITNNVDLTANGHTYSNEPYREKPSDWGASIGLRRNFALGGVPEVERPVPDDAIMGMLARGVGRSEEPVDDDMPTEPVRVAGLLPPSLFTAGAKAAKGAGKATKEVKPLEGVAPAATAVEEAVPLSGVARAAPEEIPAGVGVKPPAIEPPPVEPVTMPSTPEAAKAAVVESADRLGAKPSHKDFALDVEREERATSAARLTPHEKTNIAEIAKKTGVEPAEIEQSYLATKSKYPTSDGWAPLEPTGVARDGQGAPKRNEDGTVELKYGEQPYNFHKKKGTDDARAGVTEWDQKHIAKMADNVAKEVTAVADKADAGQKNASIIMAAKSWYRNMRDRLRQEYGGFADTLADTLGTTSAQTGVRQNWNNAIEVMSQLSRGAYDRSLQKLSDFLEAGGEMGSAANKRGNGYINLHHADLQAAMPQAIEQAKAEGLVKPKAINDRAKEIAFQAAQAGDYPLITKADGRTLFNANSPQTMLALLDLFRTRKAGDSPKTPNFTGNLIGYSDKATIDLWAARFLRRLSGRNRVPPVSESGVSGAVLADPLPSGIQVGGEFGFGQEVFQKAAEKLRRDPRFKDLGDDDLQAIAWFLEKERWSAKNYTNKTGEGGSFEQEANLAGVSDRELLKDLRNKAETDPTAKERRDISSFLADSKPRADAQAVLKENGWILDHSTPARRRTAVAEKTGVTDVFEAQRQADEMYAKAKEAQKTVDTYDKKAARLSKLETDLETTQASAHKQLDAMQAPARRFVGGISPDRVDAPATPKMFAEGQGEFAKVLDADPDVIMHRSTPSRGRYIDPQGNVFDEKAYDTEFVTRQKFDANPMMRKMVEQAKKRDQDSVFLSEVVEPGSMPGANPGMEIYFTKKLSGAEAEKVTEVINKLGVDAGFTFVTDFKAANRAAAGKSVDQYVGLRMQYIPEFGGGAEGAGAAQKKMRAALNELAETPGFSSARYVEYDTQVIFKDGYDGYLAGNAPAGRAGTWSGQRSGARDEAAAGSPKGQQEPVGGATVRGGRSGPEAARGSAAEKVTRASGGGVFEAASRLARKYRAGGGDVSDDAPFDEPARSPFEIAAARVSRAAHPEGGRQEGAITRGLDAIGVGAYNAGAAIPRLVNAHMEE